MGMFIDQTKALTALARMMGKRVLPQGNNDDWKDYVQTAFNYAWRYYEWDWSLRYVTVDMDADPYLPADFDIGGYRQAMPNIDGEIMELRLVEFARMPNGTRNYALQWDDTVKRYKILTKTSMPTIDFVYQITPPDLAAKDDEGDLIQVPFPSSMTIGIGAAIYAKQGENPTRAEISQEWDEFHAELDRHVGRVDGHAPQATNKNLQDLYDTYTGDTRY